ncbi:MAG: C45 family peptidase [Planctomycetota bacterium]
MKLPLSLFAPLALWLAPFADAQEGALRSDRVVAGGPDAFLEARHLVLRGTQEEIGAALAELARDELGTRPWPSRDTRVTRVQRRYIERVWPTHHARMRGAARAFDSSLEESAVNHSVLGYDLGDTFGCTVVYFPPGTTSEGEPVLSRNLDFTSGMTDGRRPGPDQHAAMSRPFVIESYPDEGYASLFTCSMDLLGSAFDGVNEKGLTVALLSDRELMNKYDMVPTGDLAVGLNEIQVPRFLLETCADVDEAKDALLLLRQYYAFLPCHYVVGDAGGRAFVFEGSPERNRTFFIERPGEPLISTNFMLHANPDPEAAESPGPKSSLGRYQGVCAVLEAASAPYDVGTIRSASRRAAFDGPGPPPQMPYAPSRTLWHAVYYPERGALSIDFYLGEQPDSDDPDYPEILRSGYLDFALNAERR